MMHSKETLTWLLSTWAYNVFRAAFIPQSTHCHSPATLDIKVTKVTKVAKDITANKVFKVVKVSKFVRVIKRIDHLCHPAPHQEVASLILLTHHHPTPTSWTPLFRLGKPRSKQIMAHNLMFIHISVIGGHMHIVRVSGLVTFPTMLTGIRGDRDVLALNVIIQVR